MECPVCNMEAELFAEAKPNGWIGCLCWECKKCYVTKDPEHGWEELLNINYDAELAHDLQSMHGIDIRNELLGTMKIEFEQWLMNFWGQ